MNTLNPLKEMEILTKAPAVNENESLLRFERLDYIPTLCNSSTIMCIFVTRDSGHVNPNHQVWNELRRQLNTFLAKY